MKRETPLVEAVRRALNSDKLPMHMPGHKRNAGLGEALSDLYSKRLLDFDFTEVEGLDDLHHPHGAIEKAQQLAARCFGARETLFLVNGGTAGIHAAIMACCREGDLVAVPRGAHRSVFEGLVLSGADPAYYATEIDTELCLPLGTSRDEVARLLDSRPVRALVLVHPTYHGSASDLDVIGMAAERGVAVIVDETHGAHFAFDPRLPAAALATGADIVVHGTHKTLGSLTQTGMLHIGSKEVDSGKVRKCLSLLQSSSPSYVLMASLDAMRSDMETGGPALVARAVDLAWNLRSEIERIPGFSCAEFWGKHGFDPTKLVLQYRGMTGYTLGRLLRSEYGIFPETEEVAAVLLMVAVGDTEDQIRQVVEGLENFAGREYPPEPYDPQIGLLLSAIAGTAPLVEVSPRDSLKYRVRSVRLSESSGEICGSMVVPFPPGIPAVCPGERISDSVVEYLVSMIGLGHHVQGLGNEKIPEIMILECS